MKQQLYYIVFYKESGQYLRNKDGKIYQYSDKEKAREEVKKNEGTALCRGGVLGNGIVIV